MPQVISLREVILKITVVPENGEASARILRSTPEAGLVVRVITDSEIFRMGEVQWL